MAGGVLRFPSDITGNEKLLCEQIGAAISRSDDIQKEHRAYFGLAWKNIRNTTRFVQMW